MRRAVATSPPAARAVTRGSSPRAASGAQARIAVATSASRLVRLREIGLIPGGLAAGGAAVVQRGLAQIAGRRAGRLLDERFALGPAAPWDVDHPGAFRAQTQELVAIGGRERVLGEERLRLREHVLLDLLEDLRNARDDLAE